MLCWSLQYGTVNSLKMYSGWPEARKHCTRQVLTSWHECMVLVFWVETEMVSCMLRFIKCHSSHFCHRMFWPPKYSFSWNPYIILLKILAPPPHPTLLWASLPEGKSCQEWISGKKGLECYIGVMIFHKMKSENENNAQKFDLILKPAITYAGCHS